MATSGRTIGRYVAFIIGDTSNVLRTIPINSLGPVGLNYPTVDVAAWSDAVRGVLLNTPDFTLDVGGPFDTTTHGYLSALNGENTPRTLDIQFGVQSAWDAGEPQFGISRSATSGVLVTNYTVDIAAGAFKATIVMFAGSSAPAWGTAAEV